MKVSAYSKAFTGGVLAGIAAAVPCLADGKITLGEWLMILGATLGSAFGVTQTKNTQVVKTGPGSEPKTVGTVVSDAGDVVGQVVADTGAATGGIVAGTTGVVGGLLDATVGKLLPGGKG